MHIQVRNLSKFYSQKKGLMPISFEVAKGEMVAIVGHNGAGKSTLLKMLANWILPDAGQVLIDGIDLKNRELVTRKLGFVPEVPNLFEFFSVEYNFKLFADLFKIPHSRVDELLHEFNLIPFKKNKIRDLSKGLKQRVNIGRTLLSNPPVLIFDEPTSGLDFEMTKEIYRMLGAMHEAGKTILFTTHHPEEVKNLATRILVLHQGLLVFDGTPSEYFQSATYKDLYTLI